MKTPQLPSHCHTVKTYKELSQFIQAFGLGHLTFLMVVGRAGTGKSEHFREAVGSDVAWIDGRATAFGIYCDAFEHRNQPIVLDDIDALYRDRPGVRLLKALCQSQSCKTLGWHSDARVLTRLGIPRRFETTSRVALITNQWNSINQDVAALEDRAHLIEFNPSKLEVHLQAAQWFTDQEVFDFIGQQLSFLQVHSLRSYGRALELKEAGIDWKEMILSQCFSGKTLLVAQLKADPKFATEDDRIQAFIESGAGCRATYFNHAKKLCSNEKVPIVKLPNAGVKDAKPSILEVLQKRHRRLGKG